MDHTLVRIMLGDRTLSGRLWDNPAAASLLAQLPVSLEFADYGGQEVLAKPPRALTMNGMPAGESAPAGTIGYYAPGGVIVLYYTDVPRYPGIVRIGRIDDGLPALTGWTGPQIITIEQTSSSGGIR